MTILFDFDGTIADSIAAGVAIYNGIATKKGFVRITDENRPELQTMKPREGIKRLGIRFYQVPSILRKLRSGMDVQSLQMYPGIAEVLAELKRSGHTLGILTSNSEENLRVFLKKHNLEIFDLIQSGSSVFGKARLLRRMIKKYRLDRASVVFVGDELRDIEAAVKAHVVAVAVSWGLNPHHALEQAQPSGGVADNAEQLLKLVNSALLDQSVV